MLQDKCIVLGVTGSIAAYKIASLASLLVKNGADVKVIMTKNACEFISPFTFETLTKNKCIVDTFDKGFDYDVKHVELAKKADIFVIAPASANIIGKIASGIADDMLTTTAITLHCKKLVFPTMNTHMYLNPILQDNLKKLERFGYEIVKPATGHLACNDTGIGKMPEIDVIFEYILKNIRYSVKDMVGKNVLVTAGATMEQIDPVRYITNHSSGKMGYKIAKECMLRGANVKLISANASIEPPMFVETIKVKSAEDMLCACMENYEDADFIFKAAAVSDYTPINKSENKIKKKDESLFIELKKTEDIIKKISENKKDGQIICGFSMETENLEENSSKKLKEKNLDMIVANNLNDFGAGFKTDTNKVSIITEDEIIRYPLMSKDDVAHNVVDIALSLAKK